MEDICIASITINNNFLRHRVIGQFVFFFTVLYQNVTNFRDDDKFYWFVMDYSSPPLSVHQFIYNIISYTKFDEYDTVAVSPSSTANKRPRYIRISQFLMLYFHLSSALSLSRQRRAALSLLLTV